MMRVWRGSSSSKRSGFLAGLTLLAAVGFLYLNFEPAPAGADRKHRKIDLARLASTVQSLPKPAATTIVPVPTAPAKPGEKVAAPAPGEFDRIAMLDEHGPLGAGATTPGRDPDYTCTFYKQERIGSELGDGQSIELKMRHKPFSVYMKWLSGDKGREVLYVDGVDDNRMTVHPGGWKARIHAGHQARPGRHRSP